MTKSYTLKELASLIGGDVLGDETLKVENFVHPAAAKGAEDFALAIDPKLRPILDESAAVTALLSQGAELGELKGCILVNRGRFAMSKLTELFFEAVPVEQGIHPTAVIEEGAKIGKNVTIGALSFVGREAVIGDNAVLHPRVYIAPKATIGADALIYSGVCIGARVQIGDRFIAHFNASIGADGFSFVTPEPGSVESAKAGGSVQGTNTHLARIYSLGSVILGDDVEIGANSSIDNGTMMPTKIGNGTKIDNQVQIGHNVQIGENCMLCGRVGIAGSAKLGDRVVLGGATGVADHVEIGNDVVAMGMSGIAGKIKDKLVIGGMPAVPRKRALEQYVNQGRIGGLIKKVESLTERIVELEKEAKKEETP